MENLSWKKYKNIFKYLYYFRRLKFNHIHAVIPHFKMPYCIYESYVTYILAFARIGLKDFVKINCKNKVLI